MAYELLGNFIVILGASFMNRLDLDGRFAEMTDRYNMSRVEPARFVVACVAGGFCLFLRVGNGGEAAE